MYQQRTIEEKRELLQTLAIWRENGGTITDFAKAQKTCRRNLYSWKDEVAAFDKEVEHDHGVSPGFVQLREEEPASWSSTRSSGVPIRLQRAGVTIELPKGFSVEDLKIILTSMEEAGNV